MGIRRTSSKLHVRAQVIGAALAVCAGPTRIGGFNGHRHAGLEGLYSGSDGVHSGRGFVAHGQGVGSRDVFAVNAAILPEVHVAAADADVGDADYDVSGICGSVEGWDRVVLDFGVSSPIEVYRGILVTI